MTSLKRKISRIKFYSLFKDLAPSKPSKRMGDKLKHISKGITASNLLKI